MKLEINYYELALIILILAFIALIIIDRNNTNTAQQSIAINHFNSFSIWKSL